VVAVIAQGLALSGGVVVAGESFRKLSPARQ
jgi:hypothetical protein